MVSFWHLSNNNFYDLNLYSQQHEEGLALTMLAEQKEDGRLEGAFQPRERPTDALVYQGSGCDEEGT
jgi:hypothetical protein